MVLKNLLLVFSSLTRCDAMTPLGSKLIFFFQNRDTPMRKQSKHISEQDIMFCKTIITEQDFTESCKMDLTLINNTRFGLQTF